MTKKRLNLRIFSNENLGCSKEEKNMIPSRLMTIMKLIYMATGSPIYADYESIIPEPTTIKHKSGSFAFGKIIRVFGEIEPHFKSELHDLQFELINVEDEKSADLVIRQIRNSKINIESYCLDITPEKVVIAAPSRVGQFWALQSLKQLILQNPVLSCVIIKDEPRFGYRGMHLDVSRHMFPVSAIKKYIDLMALYKFNTFHWHLTDDQGWRVEIKSYPKLQTISAFRKETVINTLNKEHQLAFDGKPYGGYYTQDEIKEIVKYAENKNITIIPEIDIPGHCLAVLAAYPELACHQKEFEVGTHWMISDDILCASNQKVYEFLEVVLTEITNLFPSRYIHIGGDEVPKQSWMNCSKCQKIIKEHQLKDENHLQGFFIKKIEDMLAKKGRLIFGWDEILEGQIEKTAAVMAWTRRGEKAKLAASLGHNVVVCPQKPLYFDHYQSQEDSEPVAIGGFNSLEMVYQFEPYIETLDSSDKKNIIGVQGNVWTEYMPSFEHVEYMAFPRMLALSEVAWCKNSKKNYQKFKKRLTKQKNILDFYQVNYARHELR